MTEVGAWDPGRVGGTGLAKRGSHWWVSDSGDSARVFAHVFSHFLGGLGPGRLRALRASDSGGLPVRLRHIFSHFLVGIGPGGLG